MNHETEKAIDAEFTVSTIVSCPKCGTKPLALNRTRWRYTLASLSAPPLALLVPPLSSSQYSSNASFATHGLRGEDVIRATNGPAYYTFAAFVPPAFVALPSYFDNTPQPTKNILRAHVALLYFCDRERERFIEKAYPKIAQTRKSRAALTPEK